MAKSPPKNPGGRKPDSSSPSTNDSGSGKSDRINAISAEIEEIEIQIKEAVKEDKQNQLEHVRTVNGKKQEIRQTTEQTWDTRVEVASASLQVGQSKAESAQDKVGQEQEITSLNKTLGEERVAKVRRKIYAVHEFDGVDD